METSRTTLNSEEAANYPGSELPARRDWRKPELQNELRAGTVLVAYDGGHFQVIEVVQEGIVVYGVITPRRLLDWEEMTEYNMEIVSQPANGEAPVPVVPRCMERGGRFTSAEIRELRKAATVARDHRSLDLLLVSQLGRLARIGGDGVRLSVVAPASGGFELATSDLNWLALDRAPTPELRVAVARMYEWVEECQGTPWETLTLVVERLDGENWRYEIRFGYPSS